MPLRPKQMESWLKTVLASLLLYFEAITHPSKASGTEIPLKNWLAVPVTTEPAVISPSPVNGPAPVSRQKNLPMNQARPFYTCVGACVQETDYLKAISLDGHRICSRPNPCTWKLSLRHLEPLKKCPALPVRIFTSSLHGQDPDNWHLPFPLALKFQSQFMRALRSSEEILSMASTEKKETSIPTSS